MTDQDSTKATKQQHQEEAEVPEGDESETHGILNLEEARCHTQSLDQAMTTMAEQISTGETEDTMKNMVERFKTAIAKIIPVMTEPTTISIIKSKKDQNVFA